MDSTDVLGGLVSQPQAAALTTCGKGGVPKASMDIPKVKLYPVSYRTIQRIGAKDPMSVRRVWIRSLQHQENEGTSQPPPVYERYKELFSGPPEA